MKDFGRRGILALAGLALVSPLLPHPPAPAQSPPKRAVRTQAEAITVEAQPIATFNPREPAATRFGALDFRGGLVLTSSAKDFGGLSGISVSSDGGFLAVTDRGRWVAGRIAYDGVRPSAVLDTQIAPMLGPDGRPVAARGWYDTEALAVHDGIAYVGVERRHVILRFEIARSGLAARGQPVEAPAAIRTLPSNQGVEGLAVVPRGQPLGGTLIAVSERGRDAAGNIVGFLIGGPSPGGFSVRRSENYDISDAALLPGGDLLILERKFSLLSGLGIRIRRIAQDALRLDATVDGPTLLEADLGYQVDNMEGLSVHRASTGEVVLTLVSDDNFSVLQRTLLLQFTLVGE